MLVPFGLTNTAASRQPDGLRHPAFSIVDGASAAQRQRPRAGTDDRRLGAKKEGHRLRRWRLRHRDRRNSFDAGAMPERWGSAAYLASPPQLAGIVRAGAG